RKGAQMVCGLPCGYKARSGQGCGGGDKRIDDQDPQQFGLRDNAHTAHPVDGYGGTTYEEKAAQRAAAGVAARRARIRRRPRPLQTSISNTRRIIVMIVLAMGGFAIGTTEFVSMGLLPMIASDLEISEGQASHIISAYALGVVVGAPLITALTGKIPRRRLLLFLMLAFIIGNGLGI